MNLKETVAAQIPHLRRFARALSGGSAYADDLVQDCVERALSRLHLFDQRKDMRVWLFTILRNLHVNQQRKQARQGIKVDVEEAGEVELFREPEQSRQLVLHDVADAILRLPLEQREVLLLITLEGLSYNETAQALGIPAGTVMSRLSRARRQLSVFMGDDKPQLRRVK